MLTIKNKQIKKSLAFTLAEVLITLGIIGVVAAMTIPILQSEYKKSVIETRLEKFYTNINQAIKLSEIDNGDKKTWDIIPSISTDVKTWYDKYLNNYLKTTTIDSTTDSTRLIIYFQDGSATIFNFSGWSFFPEGKDKYITKYLSGDVSDSGINYFSFGFWPNDSSAFFILHFNKGVEPYQYKWTGTTDTYAVQSKLGCQETVTMSRAYCTIVIATNSWKIPDNYFHKF